MWQLLPKRGSSPSPLHFGLASCRNNIPAASRLPKVRLRLCRGTNEFRTAFPAVSIVNNMPCDVAGTPSYLYTI